MFLCFLCDFWWFFHFHLWHRRSHANDFLVPFFPHETTTAAPGGLTFGTGELPLDFWAVYMLQLTHTQWYGTQKKRQEKPAPHKIVPWDSKLNLSVRVKCARIGNLRKMETFRCFYSLANVQKEQEMKIAFVCLIWLLERKLRNTAIRFWQRKYLIRGNERERKWMFLKIIQMVES